MTMIFLRSEHLNQF